MKKSFGEFFLNCKECVLESPRSFYGSFSLGPFGNTQSLTIANALRRTLLTEIRGISITHVHIDGVFHEYSTLEGVRESVLDILLNFKQIVLRTSKPFKKPVYGYLNVRGPGIVRVSDVKLPPNVQCVDPDQYIATLNENGRLSLKIRISDFSSSNFEISEFFTSKSETENIQTLEKKNIFSKDQKTNFLLVDATFNPILKVNYLIETLPSAPLDFWNSREEQVPKKSRENQVISLELWTNGSIHPRKALNLSMSFLKNVFEKFQDMQHFSSNVSSRFFESDETLLKILKTFEYDFRFYGTDFVSLFATGEAREKRDSTDFLLINEQMHTLNSRKEISPKALDLSVKVLALPSRIEDCLIRNNFLTIADVLEFLSLKKELQFASFDQRKEQEKLSDSLNERLANVSSKVVSVDGKMVSSQRKEVQKFFGLGNFSLCLIQKKLKKLGFELKK
jgi:DNA-directed RNA polymerase subunit alpha